MIASAVNLFGHQLDVPDQTMPLVLTLIGVAAVAVMMAFLSASKAVAYRRQRNLATRAADESAKMAAVVLNLHPEDVLALLRKGILPNLEAVTYDLTEKGKP